MVESTHTSGFWPAVYEPFRTARARLADWIAPASEALETSGDYVVAIELPGVAEDDISLDIQDGVLTLRGEKRTEHEEKGDTWFFSERQYGAFSRSFRLPPDADGQGVQADLNNGVLSVRIPKVKSSEPEKTKITIRKS